MTGRRQCFAELLLAIFALSFASVQASACDRPLRPFEILDEFSETLARWRSKDHPLQGRVWSRSAGLLLDTSERPDCCSSCDEPGYAVMIDAIHDGQIVLLGEIHDNKTHHELRAKILIAPLAAKKRDRDWPPFGVVFEQFDSGTTLQADPMQRPTNLEGFKDAVDWQKSGWSKYNYDPLLQAAIDARLPVYAGDVPRETILKVAKEGEIAVADEEKKRLALDISLGDKLDAASRDEIYDAHCQSMPKDALGGIAFAQRLRDATLADNVLKAAEKHGSAILIAGNGHVRTDRGVPWYIRQRAPDKKVVSVMLIEVEEGKNDPEAYVPRDPGGKPAADYIIFTPRAGRSDDPCAKFKAK